MNGSAVEGLERLDGKIGGIRITVRDLRQCMRVLASVVQEVDQIYTCRWAPVMARASLGFVGHRNFGGPFQSKRWMSVGGTPLGPVNRETCTVYVPFFLRRQISLALP